MIDRPLFSVAGKTVLVTGGSSGLGLRMVRLLAGHGANVVSLALTLPAEEANVGEVNAEPPGEVHNIIADVTDPDDIERAFDETERRFGVATIVFNNAGIANRARALDTDRKMLRHILDINVEAAFFVACEAARRMIAAGEGGSIVNSSSILAELPVKGSAAYAISKAAVTQMTRSLALEWAANDIRVNAIAPGWFPTRLNEDVMQGPAMGFFKGRNPMRRLGDPQDIDGAVLMLASDASRYMTGTVITIDGGHSLHG
ncbi:MAG: SDR family NAD(P)-dependent oxidoreductase [Phyllobacterium sp.]